MSVRTRKPSAIPSSSLLRASQDQDFDPFSSQSSSRSTPRHSKSQNGRRALAEETNSAMPSRSQTESARRTSVKRAPSEEPDLPSPSTNTHNSQRTPTAANGTTRMRRLSSDESRHQSSSPAKRRRATPASQTTPIANGRSSRRREPEPESAALNGNRDSFSSDDQEGSDAEEEEAEDIVGDDQGELGDLIHDTLVAAPDTDPANNVESALHRKGRSPDRYLPGAIRRIALSNFLTYDSVNFHVGPYLNLICGPNGTGKSSIACAIALGLGGHPSLLGRASQLGSFVKRGETDGWIEIELQANPGESNPVIRRTLTTASNKSDWSVDGRSSTKHDVLAMVSEYNIDVANLCSFLPQDKVHEFAKMTDAKRLVETEKAVGGQRLVRWHERLNEHGKTLAEIMSQLKAQQDEKAHLEQRNQALQVDVQRFEERKHIEEKIEKIEVMIAMADYNRTKRNIEELVTERDRKRDELAAACERGKPIRAKKAELEEQTTKINLQLQRLETTLNSDEKKRKQLVRTVEEVGGEIESKLGEVGNLNKKDQDRARRIQELKKEITDRTAALGEAPGAGDTAQIEADMRRIRSKIDTCHTKRGDIQRSIQEINIESRSIDRGMDSSRQQLAQLDNVPQQRLEKVRSADQDVFKATMWLRENQHRFRKPVYEPVLMEISLKDQRYAAAVESCIPFAVQKSFVCQTREDYDVFTRELIDRQRLRLTVAEVEGITLDSMRPDVPREELSSYGFDSYIIDQIEGPEDVLVHLCRQSHLHRLPVTLNPNVDVERVEQSGKFRRFIAGGENFTINISRYGSDVRQTVSRRIGQARSLVDSIDRERQRNLSRQIQELSAKKKELEASTQALLKEDKGIQAEMARYDAEINDLKSAKRDQVGAQRQWEKDSAMLEARRRELRDKEKEPSAAEKRARLMKEIRKLAEKRGQKMQDLVAQTVQMSKVADRKHENSLKKWQWDATATQLENALRDISESERELAASLEQAVNAYQRARREASELRAQVQQLIDQAGELVVGIDPNDDELLDLDRLNADLRVEQSKLELAEGVRPEVIDQYRQRQKEIQTLTAKITDLEELQARTREKIHTTRAKWEPTLRGVISAVSAQFSSAFDSMGLAGELRIVEDSDFEKWKLEIMVKFRNEEELAPLSAQHQSGGERTLSTIMYIMSLLQLSRSPFTLVDEINQGMDPTAERVTHDYIVGLTCRVNASQYFLITPKLLPDLRVSELQKVLLVNNGVYGERRFSFREVLERKRKAKGLGLGLEEGRRCNGTERVMERVWAEASAAAAEGNARGVGGKSRR